MNNSMSSKYDKPFLPVSEQISLLQERTGNLGSPQDLSYNKKIISYLNHIGYQRLDKYFNLFQDDDKNFLPHFNIKFATSIYELDSRLRLHILDALEKIEISFRTNVAIIIGRQNPMGYLDENFLNKEKCNKKLTGSTDSNFSLWERKYIDKLNQDKHLKKYDKETISVWLAVNCWDFGMLFTIIKLLKFNDFIEFASIYNIKENHKDFLSWINTLRHVRNKCAHYDILLNQNLEVHKPGIKSSPIAQLIADNQQNSLYCLCVIIFYLLKIINPDTKWHNQLKSLLIDQFPKMPDNIKEIVNIEKSGFLLGWDTNDFWNKKINKDSITNQ